MKDKRSFFERLTGTINLRGNDEAGRNVPVQNSEKALNGNGKRVAQTPDEPEEGELTVDVYQTPDDIILKTFAAGLRPEDLDISITREMVTIRGSRQESSEMREGDYIHHELYWGTFSRTILLPQEVDVDAAEATERHGLLTIRLPKLDKSRQTKLKVRSS